MTRRNIDVAWKHCTKAEGYPTGTKCNYCQKIIGGGGITRFKRHLAGGDPNVTACVKQGQAIRNMFRQLIADERLRKYDKRRRQSAFVSSMVS
ncbi:hypothetical protein ACHQM5_028166 [Ranunculus cassubicifolius]